MKRKMYYTSSIMIIGVGIVATAGVMNPYVVPMYERPEVQIWDAQSVDTMKASRDKARDESSDAPFIIDQVKAINEIGASHIAIATPYDTEFDDFRNSWITAARDQNLSIWYRGNWAGWEEWFDYPAIARRDHIVRTRNFIREHPEMFEHGDIFEPCQECENGGPGDPRLTGDIVGYREFIIQLFTASKEEFEKMEKDVTVLFSMNGDIAREVLDGDTTQAIGNTIAMDHYVIDGETLSTDAALQARRSNGEIYLSEIGVPVPDIHGSFTEAEQQAWLEDALNKIAQNRTVTSINYWVDRGGSTAIFSENGEPRASVATLTKYYTPFSIYGVIVDTLGFPIENVSVATPFGYTVTNEEGYFQLPSIRDHTTVSVWKEKYISQDIAILEKDAEMQQHIFLEKERESIFFKLQKALF
jgi:hypothetical protein